MKNMKIIEKKIIINLCSITCIIAIISSAAHLINKVKSNDNQITYSDSDDVKTNNKEEFELIDDGEEIIELEDMISSRWYVLKVKYDDKNTNIIMTRKTTIEKYNNGSIDYYYTDVFKGDYKVYRVNYNCNNETFSIISGPEILEAIPIQDLLEEYVLKDTYTKQELYKYLSELKQNNKKKLSGSSYSLKNGKIKH